MDGISATFHIRPMTAPARRGRLRIVLIPVALLAACISEFAPTDAFQTRIERGAAWADTLQLAEIATFDVAMTGADGRLIAGPALVWETTDSGVVTITRGTDTPGASLSESVRAIVIARAVGAAEIIVRTTDEAVAPLGALRVPVVVRRSDSDSTLTVGDVDTVGVALNRAEATLRNGARIEWTASDASILQVAPLPSDPARAVVTARSVGTANISAAIESPRLGRSVLQLPVHVGAVTITPASTWPDVLTVTDSTRLTVNVSRPGSRTRWSSTNVAAFRVDSTGLMTAYAEGGGEIVASVGEAPFQVFEYRAPVVVRPLQVVEALAWPSSVNLTNTATFSVSVLDAKGQPRPGLPVTWRSTNETAFSVDASGTILGKQRGGGELVATVGQAPFQSSEHRKSIGVLQKWSAVTAGNEHTCAIAAVDQSAWCWGDNTAGELGDGATTVSMRSLPNRVATPFGFEQLSAGGVGTLPYDGNRAHYEAHTCGIVAYTDVLCWGSTFSGQVGDNAPACGTFDACRRMLPFVAISNAIVSTVVTGGRHTCAKVDNLQAWVTLCWGMTNGPVPFPGYPAQVLQEQTFRFFPSYPIAAGGEFVCLIDHSSFLLCGGRNDGGQLADDTFSNHEIQCCGTYADGNRITGSDDHHLTAGFRHACMWEARFGSSQILCWGGGMELYDPAAYPTAIVIPGGAVRNVSAGGGCLTVGPCHDFTCALAGTSDTYCWDVGGSPQLVPGGQKFVAIDAGGAHTCGLTADGSIYCWGENGRGQLGDGSTTYRATPVRVGEPP